MIQLIPGGRNPARYNFSWRDMMITLEQAFQNVDNVVAEAPMSRNQHAALIESIKIIKAAAYPKDDAEESEDENNGGTDSSTDD